MMRFLLLIGLLIVPIASAGADATVDAVLASPRTEPRHAVDVALALLDLGRPEAAQSISEELLALPIDEAGRAALVDKVGTAKLSRLARELPATADFVAGCLAASSGGRLTPERLEELARAVLSAEGEALREAVLQMSRTGQAGAAHCLDALASTNNAEQQARLREALVALAPISVPLLYSALGDETAAVQEQSVLALGRLAELNQLGSPIAVALVAGPAVTRPAGDPVGKASRWAHLKMTGQPASTAAAAREIERVCEKLLDGELALKSDSEGLVSWRDDRSQPIERVPARQASIALAARLAEDRSAIDPADGGWRRRAALLRAESDGQPPAGLDDLSPHDWSEALGEALEASLDRAAAGICRLLGEASAPSVLLTHDSRPSPLAEALVAAEPAVRFAALDAVLQLDPQSPYPGSSRVPEAIAYFAAGEGSPRAVVACPNLSSASDLAGWLQQAGYASEGVNNGLAAFDLAGRSPDTRFVLLDLATIRPPVRETLFRLRRDPSTAVLPVALLTSPGRLAEARLIASEHGGEAAGVIALPKPTNAESIATLLPRLESLATPDDAETRRAWAERAREAAARIATEGPRFYRPVTP